MEPSQLTINGVIFEFTPRYSDGQTLVLSAPEANAFNSVLGDNLRNNYSPRVRAVRERLGLGIEDELPDDEIAALRADFAEYQAKYQFSLPGRRVVIDPLQNLSEKLAREAIATKLRSQGKALKDFSDEWLDAKIEEVLKDNPQIVEEAKRRLEAAKSAAEVVFNI